MATASPASASENVQSLPAVMQQGQEGGSEQCEPQGYPSRAEQREDATVKGCHVGVEWQGEEEHDVEEKLLHKDTDSGILAGEGGFDPIGELQTVPVVSDNEDSPSTVLQEHASPSTPGPDGDHIPGASGARGVEKDEDEVKSKLGMEVLATIHAVDEPSLLIVDACPPGEFVAGEQSEKMPQVDAAATATDTPALEIEKDPVEVCSAPPEAEAHALNVTIAPEQKSNSAVEGSKDERNAHRSKSSSPLRAKAKKLPKPTPHGGCNQLPACGAGLGAQGERGHDSKENMRPNFCPPLQIFPASLDDLQRSRLWDPALAPAKVELRVEDRLLSAGGCSQVLPCLIELAGKCKTSGLCERALRKTGFGDVAGRADLVTTNFARSHATDMAPLVLKHW